MSKFIVFEGLEGSGKTTIAKHVVNFLKDHGIYDVISIRDPGSTPISEIFRSLIKLGRDGEDAEITSYAELLLFYAARVQLLENVIKPALLRGTWVISDRYDFSSYAYQGGGRGINKFFIKYLSKIVLNNFSPDKIFYLDVPPEIGFSRIKNMRILDYIEKEPLSFFNRVRSSYQLLANKSTNAITIDATKNLNEVNDDICQYIKRWLNFKC